MGEMLLINPRKRRKSRKAASPAQKRARAKFAAMARSRRRNPVAAAPRRRRRNPIANMTSRAAVARVSNPRRRARSVRRRRNPITLQSTTRMLFKQVQDAAIGAAGAIGVDMLMAQINPMLPPAFQKVPGAVGLADATKAIVTVVAGQLLHKATRGLSTKAALGSLTVQAHGIISTLLPAGTLGFYSPASIVQGSQRVGPLQARNRIGAYMRPGSTPMLNAYIAPGASPLLSGRMSAREREGMSIR